MVNAQVLLLRLAVASFLILAASLCRAQTWGDKVVAAVVMGEACDQGSTGMLAVAEVISTRCAQKQATPYQIVTRRRAFSCLNGTSPQRLVRKWQNEPQYAQALELAMRIHRAPQLFPGITRGATHFTRSDEKPGWARSQKPVALIGSHAFYCLTRY